MRVPGHSPGHVAGWVAKEGVLLAGDAVLGAGDRGRSGALEYPAAVLLPAAYRQTLAQIRALSPRVLLLAHLPVLEGADIVDYLDESVGFVNAMQAAVSGALAVGRPMALPELIDRMLDAFRVYPQAAKPGFVGPVLGTLRDFERQGIAVRNGFSWSLAGDAR